MKGWKRGREKREREKRGRGEGIKSSILPIPSFQSQAFILPIFLVF
jgi:hypothetical protein